MHTGLRERSEGRDCCPGLLVAFQVLVPGWGRCWVGAMVCAPAGAAPGTVPQHRPSCLVIAASLAGGARSPSAALHASVSAGVSGARESPREPTQQREGGSEESPGSRFNPRAQRHPPPLGGGATGTSSAASAVGAQLVGRASRHRRRVRSEALQSRGPAAPAPD